MHSWGTTGYFEVALLLWNISASNDFQGISKETSMQIYSWIMIWLKDIFEKYPVIVILMVYSSWLEWVVFSTE